MLNVHRLLYDEDALIPFMFGGAFLSVIPSAILSGVFDSGYYMMGALLCPVFVVLYISIFSLCTLLKLYRTKCKFLYLVYNWYFKKKFPTLRWVLTIAYPKRFKRDYICEHGSYLHRQVFEYKKGKCKLCNNFYHG